MEDIVDALYRCPTQEKFGEDSQCGLNQGTPSLRQSNSFVDITGFICAKNWTKNYFQPSHGHYGIVDWESKPPNWIKCWNEQSNSSWILAPAQSRFPLLRNGMSVNGLLQTLHATRSPFHGATFEQKNKAGLGVGIRNQEGLVMASLSQLIQLPPNTVIEVEALAARLAVELAIELGFDHIVLEGDSEILIKILKNNSSTLAPLGHIVNNIFFPGIAFLCF